MKITNQHEPLYKYLYLSNTFNVLQRGIFLEVSNNMCRVHRNPLKIILHGVLSLVISSLIIRLISPPNEQLVHRHVNMDWSSRVHDNYFARPHLLQLAPLLSLFVWCCLFELLSLTTQMKVQLLLITSPA